MTWIRLLLLTLFLTLTVTACGSGSDDSGSNNTSSSGDGDGDGDGHGDGDGDGDTANICGDADADAVVTCTFDATSYSDYVYFTFDGQQLVELSESEALSSSAWDIALRRYSLKTNGGSSSDGTGKVGAALVDAQDDFYDAEGNPDVATFTNATAEGERDHLINASTLPDSWTMDTVVSALAPEAINDDSDCTPVSPPQYRIDYGWYIYHGGCLPTPHAISENDENGWLLRSAEASSYARFRATSVSYSSANGVSATFEFLVQLDGTSSFTEARSWQITDLDAGERCYDFDNNTEVGECSGTAWDIKLVANGQDFYLRTNSGPSGSGGAGAFGPLPWSEIGTYDNGTVGPESQPIASHYAADTSSSVVDVETWYAYNLQEQHALWPNYRVYMVNVDTDDDSSAVYALQILDYYDLVTGNESGHITLRFKPVAVD